MNNVNVGAERSVLGAFLEYPPLLNEALKMGLSENDFSLSDHRRVFEAMLSLCREDHPLQAWSFSSVLMLDTLGGEDAALLADFVVGALPEAGHVRRCVRILRRLADLRRLQALAEKVLEQASDPHADPMVIAQAIRAQLPNVEVRA